MEASPGTRFVAAFHPSNEDCGDDSLDMLPGALWPL
jgi:hypothetical protein